MDILSEHLRLIQLRGEVYFRSAFSGAWGINIEGGNAAFHIVESGSCWLVPQNQGEPLRLESGDCVILPYSTPHKLQSFSTDLHLDGHAVIEAIHNGKNPFSGADTNIDILCGHFSFRQDRANFFLKGLPEIIHLSSTKEKYRWLGQSNAMLCEEVLSRAPGSDVVIDRLLELIFIQVLRNLPHQTLGEGLVAGLREQRLHRALVAFHKSPDERWTLNRMANEANMSRSSFAQHFRQTIGITPAHYIQRWRLILAEDQLLHTRSTIETVAEAVGYKSTAAFTTAFIKHFGLSPGKYRQR